MIKYKYPTETDTFDKITRLRRNQILRGMVEKDRVIIFPENAEASSDGLPFMKIVESNLRTTKDAEEKGGGSAGKSFAKRFTRKPRVDMGLPPPKKGEEQ